MHGTYVRFLPESKDVVSYQRPRIAGSDTTSTTLSYFFWELSRRPDVAKKLRAELDEAMVDPRVIPDLSVLSNLPYFNAFIKEGQ